MKRLHDHTTRLLLFAVLLLCADSMASESASVLNLSNPTLSQLEQRAEAIDSELDQLAHYSLRSGVGAIGYRSDVYLEAEHTVWIEIQLEADTAIDQIVLVPSIWRDTKAGFKADGFPIAIPNYSRHSPRCRRHCHRLLRCAFKHTATDRSIIDPLRNHGVLGARGSVRVVTTPIRWEIQSGAL